MNTRVITALVVAIAIAAGCSDPRTPAPSKDQAALEQRVKKGAYLTNTKKLSDTEELSIMVLPSEMGEMFDVRCLIYKNLELKQVQMTCPDTTQLQLGEIER